MDKTGTLSQGQFVLVHLKTIGSRPRKEILEYLALIEERAHHPLAQAIVTGARHEGVRIPRHVSLDDHTHLPGEGVTAVVDGKIVCVGNARLFKRIGLYEKLPRDVEKAAETWLEEGGTVGFMSIEGEGIVCCYSVADAVRPEAARVVSRLKELGVESVMLTGDNSGAAMAIGKQIGLEDYQIESQLYPEDKVRVMQELKRKGKGGNGGNVGSRGSLILSRQKHELVLMVGDGVNDAPALATADVGVAMGEGAALALETSDVTLLDSNLEKLVYSIEMGRRVNRKIVENVLFSLTLKVVVIVFALFGYMQLWGAIVADVGAMLAVTVNGMTLLPSSLKTSRKTTMVENESNGYYAV